MKKGRVLGSYNLVLSGVAIYAGILMMRADGIFKSFPPEWNGKVPFDSWKNIGVFVLIIFGTGNLLASITSMSNRAKAWPVSFVMGVLLVSCVMIQVICVKEIYLASIQGIIIGIIQLMLCANVFVNRRKRVRNHTSKGVINHE